MRQLFAVAVVLLAGSGWMGAQRGGGGGAHGGGSSGFHGGVSGHAVSGLRGGFSQAALSGYRGGGAGVGRVQGYGAGGRAVAPYGAARYRGTGGPGARPAFYSRGRGDGDRRRDERREGYRAGYPYGYAGAGVVNYGWLDPGALLYPDDDGYGGDPYYGEPANGVVDEAGAPPENYVEEPQSQGPSPEEEPTASAGFVRAQPAPALYDSNAVTLVFKDGRPAETIHNYALTRTTLYVTDARHREIPVADLDLAATAKVNRAAGVTFQLPQMGQ
jgi:hypothetical protein